VWPLCGSGGEGGSRVPLAFGWEVPVRSLRSASGSGEKQERQGALKSSTGDKARYVLLSSRAIGTKTHDRIRTLIVIRLNDC
jgi:hypothetical protein